MKCNRNQGTKLIRFFSPTIYCPQLLGVTLLPRAGMFMSGFFSSWTLYPERIILEDAFETLRHIQSSSNHQEQAQKNTMKNLPIGDKVAYVVEQSFFLRSLQQLCYHSTLFKIFYCCLSVTHQILY